MDREAKPKRDKFDYVLPRVYEEPDQSKIEEA